MPGIPDVAKLLLERSTELLRLPMQREAKGCATQQHDSSYDQHVEAADHPVRGVGPNKCLAFFEFCVCFVSDGTKVLRRGERKGDFD